MQTFDADNKVTAKTPIAMPVVARMDADTGKVLSTWGADTFYMPHMLTLDREGNVWVVDCGLHQVLDRGSHPPLIGEATHHPHDASDELNSLVFIDRYSNYNVRPLHIIGRQLTGCFPC